MRKFIIAALIATTLMPVAAQAQVSPRDRAELNRDRRDVREERRDLDRAYRNGSPAQIRDARGDLRDARREYRDDARDANRNWGRNDWRGWRDTHRDVYRGGNWRSDFRYTPFRSGIRIAPAYYGSRYVIADPWRYRLPRAGFSQQWVRHYNDVLLVDVRRGVVVDVIRGFYW